MAKNGIPDFSQKDWYKFEMVKSGPFQIFSNNFSQIDWYKFGMAKNGCSKFFPTIFPKKTGINSEWPSLFGTKKTGRNLEWPKMGILNLFKPF